MRYYNENPQVTLWKEYAAHSQKIAIEAQQTSRELLQQIEEYKELLKKSDEQFIKMRDEVKDAISKHKEIKGIYYANKRLQEEFNSLPWYKKMFYKFKI